MVNFMMQQNVFHESCKGACLMHKMVLQYRKRNDEHYVNLYSPRLYKSSKKSSKGFGFSKSMESLILVLSLTKTNLEHENRGCGMLVQNGFSPEVLQGEHSCPRQNVRPETSGRTSFFPRSTKTS
jgi:hypothetical protein